MGSAIDVEVTGDDEQNAIDAVEQLFVSGDGESPADS
jgi:phosphotransferase system HPr-like phosphotransfer protein